jgi:tetratricopeptide (TPR) repeat protein
MFKAKINLAVFLALLVPYLAQAQLEVTTKGSAPSRKLKIKKSKVPSFDFKPGQEIPRLDIGTENELAYKETQLNLPQSQVQNEKIRKPNILKMVELDKKSMAIPALNPVKTISSQKTIAAVPVLDPLKDTYSPTFLEPNVALKDITLFKPQEFKLLEGQIYFENVKNYEMALAHFGELLKDKEFGLDAYYHYGLTSKELKLYSEFKNALVKVSSQSKNKDLKLWATEELVKGVSFLEINDIGDIDPLIESADFDADKYDGYQFYRAKYYLEKGNLTEVEAALALIPEKSEFYPESRFIAGLSKYRQGKVSESEAYIDEVLKNKQSLPSIQTLASLTLARIKFQKQDYKEAQKLYLAVDKDHPLWLQAMVELAWTEILIADYEGAAGNMFSLHTDFFKNAYNPESYVVRTVSYLNLCQFGDSLQVLTALGRKYAPYYGRIETYVSQKKDPADYYQTVRSWLKNPDQKDVDGVPRSFIIELARHPSFITVQKDINRLEDEITSFNQVTLSLIQREKDLIKKQGTLSQDLANVRAGLLDPKKSKEILKGEEQNILKKLQSFKYQQQGVKTARDTVKNIRDVSFARIDKDKSKHRARAGIVLKDRLTQLTSDLKDLLDQNELLQYEVYSGAGEHLRFQTVSQDVKGDDPKARELAQAQLAKEKDKKVKWNFQGEIWEDEIGHFRSSLKNVCAQEGN